MFRTGPQFSSTVNRRKEPHLPQLLRLQVPKLPQLLSFRQLLREQYSRDLSLSLESGWLAALEAIHEGLCPSTL